MMNRKKPTIIAFEGIDGSGKETQSKLLFEHLTNQNYHVVSASYPNYEGFFGQEIGGLLSASDPSLSASTVDPKSMALWYALDRWLDYEGASSQWGEADYVLLNRSTMSSMVYQSLRSSNPYGIMHWIEKLEFEILRLPKPDIFLIFDVSPRSSAQNMKSKGARSYVSSELDVYEDDADLQARSWRAYRDLAASRGDTYVIRCEDKQGVLLSKTEIFDSLCQLLALNSAT